MRIDTRQGQTLTVSLEALQRVPGGHPEPIVEFRYPGGILCSSYYLSAFLAIPDGLCLEGDRLMRQDLSSSAVASVKAWLEQATA